MKTLTRKLLAVAILFSVVFEASADKGAGKKNKNKTTLNITAPTNNIRSSIAFNLKSGLSYKGSLLNTRTVATGSIINNSIVTYQKGNSTYIIPFKTKITVAEVQQGYTGIKIIIRKK